MDLTTIVWGLFPVVLVLLTVLMSGLTGSFSMSGLDLFASIKEVDEPDMPEKARVPTTGYPMDRKLFAACFLHIVNMFQNPKNPILSSYLSVLTMGNRGRGLTRLFMERHTVDDWVNNTALLHIALPPAQLAYEFLLSVLSVGKDNKPVKKWAEAHQQACKHAKAVIDTTARYYAIMLYAPLKHKTHYFLTGSFLLSAKKDGNNTVRMHENALLLGAMSPQYYKGSGSSDKAIKGWLTGMVESAPPLTAKQTETVNQLFTFFPSGRSLHYDQLEYISGGNRPKRFYLHLIGDPFYSTKRDEKGNITELKSNWFTVLIRWNLSRLHGSADDQQFIDVVNNYREDFAERFW